MGKTFDSWRCPVCGTRKNKQGGTLRWCGLAMRGHLKSHLKEGYVREPTGFELQEKFWNKPNYCGGFIIVRTYKEEGREVEG